MEHTGYEGASSIRRQETFETDPRFAARSKSGGIKKGNLTLPIIGPKQFNKQSSAGAIPGKLKRRSSSPDVGTNKVILSDKTYTKSLLDQLIKEDINQERKVLYKLKAKTEDKPSDKNENINDYAEKKVSKRGIIIKDNRKKDTKSVDSGDSAKENKLHSKSSVLVAPLKDIDVQEKGTKTKKTLIAKNKETEKRLLAEANKFDKTIVKESKINEKKTDALLAKESKINGKKTDTSLAKDKEGKINEKKTDTVILKESKINEKKTDISIVKESKINGKKNDTSTVKENKIYEKTHLIKESDKLSSNNKEKTQKKTDVQPKDFVLVKTTAQESSGIGIKERGNVKREKIRDKLTSTPVSNFDNDIAIKPGKNFGVNVRVKETKLTNKSKETEKRIKDEKLPPLKENSKYQNKTENKQPKVQTEEQIKEVSRKTRFKQSDTSVVRETNTSQTVVKPEKAFKVKQERKRSSESLESGFASYRQIDHRKDDRGVDDISSLLSYTETEIGKPPEDTKLERPRSDKSKVSLAIEDGRPASNKSKVSKDLEIAETGTDHSVVDKNRPIDTGLPSDLNNSEKRNPSQRMEPAIQRKPGSERMTETYESIFEERRTLLDAEIAYKKRIKQLEDEINQFLKTIDDLRSENKALRNRIDSLENSQSSGNDTESNNLKLTIQSLETQNKAIESKYEKTEIRLAKLEQERDKLTSENNDLTTKLTELQTKYSKADNELAKLKLENLSSASKDDIRKLEKQVNQLNRDLQNEQSELKKVQDDNTILKTDKDVLKDEVVALRSINKNLEALNEELKNESKTTGELPNKEKMDLKSQIIKLQSDNQTLNEENIKLKAENLKQVKSIHDLQKTAKTFESSVTAVESQKITEIQDLKNENTKLKSDIKELKETFADAEGKLKSLESENKSLDQALVQKKEELTELMSALKDDDKFDTEIKNLKKENLRLQKDNEEKEKIMSDARNHLDDIKIEKDKYVKEKNQLNDKISEMLQINEEQKKKFVDLQEKLELSRKDLESNSDKLQQLHEYENEIAELKTKFRDKETEHDKVLKQKQDEIEELKLKTKRIDADSKEKIEALKMDYEKEIEQLKKQIEFLQEEIDKLRQLKVVESELIDSRDELTKVKEKYSKLVMEVESKSDLEQKNFQMSVKMTQMNNTIKQLERDQKEWLIKKQQIDEIEASNKRLQEENVKLKQRGGMQKVSNKIDKHLELLERKQKDAETRVKQLEGWVGNLYDDDQNTATYVGSMHSRKPPKKKVFSRAPAPQTSISVSNDRPRSLDDVVMKEKEKSEKSEKLSHSSSPNLPAIEPETRLTFGLGYSQIHRSRIKAAQKYRKY